MTERLDQRLKNRENALTLQRNGLMAAAVLGLLVLLYLLTTFFKAFSIDLKRLSFAMEQLAAGNLRVAGSVRSKDEIGDLADILKRMIGNISAMVAAVGSDAALVAHAGHELSIGNRDLADRTEQQAANLEQTAASVQELASTVERNAQTASDVDRQTLSVRGIAEAGAQSMQASIQSIEAIQAGARRMNEIIGVIDGLAFQTNILALNAAVEAARAGEQGRGFAVVASEVRSLAQRSAASAREIRDLIQTSSMQVETSVAQIRGAGEGIARIVSGIREVSDSISQISRASTEQSTGLSEVSSAVAQLDEITQRNAQMVERAVAQSNDLENQAGSLSAAIGNFRLQQGVALEAVALVERAAAYRTQCGSREAFLRGLTVKENNFHDRDMYVFVLDGNGTYLAFGGNPAKVGTRVQDVPGIDGDGLTRAIVNQASQGPGWVEYNITNPVSGKVQTKMSFVQQVDDTFMGCGVYKNLVVA
ncbi:MAG: cache domain-containing protein [Rhodoferax sp.]|nr:cache domain-containing protein [Rhodoferax sp.]